MNRKNVLIISVIGIIGILVIGSLLFRDYSKTREHRPYRAVKWISSELELTGDQESKLVILMEELLNLGDEFREDRGALRDEIIRMLASSEIDQARILELIDEKQKQIDEFAPVIISRVADFHQSLSLDQRKKLGEKLWNHSSGY